MSIITTSYNQWADYMRAKGTGEKHVRQMVLYAATMVEMCDGFATPATLTKGTIVQAGGLIKLAGKNPVTVNRHLTAVKAYLDYLHGEGLISNPCPALPHANEKLDRRRVRRALTDIELSRLINDGSYRPEAHGLSWGQRRLLYMLGVYMGLRANECRAMQWGWINWTTMNLEIPAENEKAKRGAVLSMPHLVYCWARDMADRDSDPSKGDPSKPVFPALLIGGIHVGDVLAHDLGLSGILRETLEGIIDFHSLRHTFLTNLGRANTPLATMQKLARHSDHRMTMRYVHSDRADERKALEAISGGAKL